LFVIGGLFSKEERDIINGMIFSIRDKHLRISLWCNNSTDKELLTKVGKKMKELSHFDSKYSFGYQIHSKALEHKLDNQNFITLA